MRPLGKPFKVDESLTVIANPLHWSSSLLGPSSVSRGGNARRYLFGSEASGA